MYIAAANVKGLNAAGKSRRLDAMRFISTLTTAYDDLSYIDSTSLQYHRLAHILTSPTVAFWLKPLARLVFHEHFQPIAEPVYRYKLVTMLGAQVKLVADGRDMGVQ